MARKHYSPDWTPPFSLQELIKDLPADSVDGDCGYKPRKSLPFLGMERYVFKILYRGRWYQVDLANTEKIWYPFVPKALLVIAERAAESVYDGLSEEELMDLGDPTPYYERALRERFDDVVLIESTYNPNIRY